MKAVNFSKILGHSTALRSVRLVLVAPALVMTFSVAQAGTSAPATASADPTAASNWIGFTVGGAFVNGDNAGMMRRTQTNGDFYGGIDTFHYAQDLKNSTTLTLDGHALPGLEDYEFNADVEKTNVGYIKSGYKQYRTWYDGSGGYMSQLGPMATPGIAANDDELHVDRGEFYLEAGLRMEKLPEITFSYKHDFRNGQKDSTSWGQRPVVTGSSLVAPWSTTGYKFLPSLWSIDELTDTFELNVEHTVGNTDLGLGLTYEHVNYSNSLSYQTGTTNNTAPATNTLANTTKTDQYTMDLFAGNVHSVTRFNDKLWLTGGFAYTTVNTDTNGTTRNISPLTGTSAALPNSTAAISNSIIPAGGGEFEQCVGNLNLMWNPIEDLTITPSLRIEQSAQSAVAEYDTYNVLNVQTAGIAYLADIHTNTTTEALDVRYTGISDLVLYAKGQWAHEDQTNWTQDVYSPVPAVLGAPSDWLHNDITIEEQDYTLGANWYPLRGLSFSLQGLYSQRDESFSPTGYNGVGGGNTVIRPAMLDHDTTTDDVNLRMTWHPMGNLSMVTRYDLRQTDYSNRGVVWGNPGAIVSGPPAAGILPEVESSDVSAQILSQSVTWSPMARLYVQGSASYTWASTTTNTLMVPDAKNNYMSACLTLGYAIDDRTDITASYSYYGANSYTQATYDPVGNVKDSIPYGMGYGLNTSEHAVSLALTRVLTPNMVWNLRYAFITSQTEGALQDQSGGFNDFTAQMVSTGLQVRF